MKTSIVPDGTVTLNFRLPEIPDRPAWKNLRTEFVVTISDKLTMELTATNNSSAAMEIENCLQSLFRGRDINQVSISRLEGPPFPDHAAGGKGARKVENDSVLRITK